MKLLVGLGNPGPKYAGHRHNVGFMAIDAIAEHEGFPPEKARFQGVVREGQITAGGASEKVLLLKPTTYMNESGRSVGEAARFFRLTPGDVIVFHDELDLAPAKLRVKQGGGTAGHNGLKSIDRHLGNDFWRVRIGIGHPGDKARVHGHVLSDFAKVERTGWVADLLDAVARSSGKLVEGDMAGFTSEVARWVRPPEPPAREGS